MDGLDSSIVQACRKTGEYMSGKDMLLIVPKLQQSILHARSHEKFIAAIFSVLHKSTYDDMLV